MAVCDDLKLGGTLSSAGLTGGFSINNTALSVADWSTLFGTVGMSGSLAGVYGRPGGYLAGDRLPRERAMTLSVNVHRFPAALADCTPSELALLENTDTFLAELSKRAGTYLEVTLPDATTRFTHVVDLDPGPMIQPRSVRRFNVPLTAPWGHWWEGGSESSQVVSGAGAVVVGGAVPVYDAVLTFAGDGTFTHSGLGWEIEIAGSSGAVVVDLGRRRVTQAGVLASNLMRRTPVPDDARLWGWFEVGSNSVTSDVSVTATWRNQYL